MSLIRSLNKWVLLVLLISQCRAVDSSPPSEKEFQKLVEENIGADYHTIPNESKTFLLCIQDIAPIKTGTHYTRYLVIELKTNRIVEKGKYLNGHCLWLNDSSLEIVDMPGALKENQQPSDFKKIVILKASQTPIP